MGQFSDHKSLLFTLIGAILLLVVLFQETDKAEGLMGATFSLVLLVVAVWLLFVGLKDWLGLDD